MVTGNEGRTHLEEVSPNIVGVPSPSCTLNPQPFTITNSQSTINNQQSAMYNTQSTLKKIKGYLKEVCLPAGSGGAGRHARAATLARIRPPPSLLARVVRTGGDLASAAAGGPPRGQGCYRRGDTLIPTPYTLHPTPCTPTLNPEPYTLTLHTDAGAASDERSRHRHPPPCCAGLLYYHLTDLR